MKKLQPWYIASGCVNASATLKNNMAVSYKVKHTILPYDPEIPILYIYPREQKTYDYTKTQSLQQSYSWNPQSGNNPNIHQWTKE